MFQNCLCLCISLLLLASCRQGSWKDDQQDRGMNENRAERYDSVSCYMDSNLVRVLLNQDEFRDSLAGSMLPYYRDRNYTMAWITRQGLSEFAGNFINLLNSEPRIKEDDSSFYKDPLHLAYREAREQGENFMPGDSSSVVLELLLTAGFLRFAERNWQGKPEEFSRSLGWFIERKKLDYMTLLSSFLQQKEGVLPFHPPVYQQYDLLKNFLQRYHELEKDSLWPTALTQVDSFPVREGDSILYAVKYMLLAYGDMASSDSSLIMDSVYLTGLKNFQQRHGLKTSGQLDRETFDQLSIPLNSRVRQLIINMERCRWVPSQIKGDYLAVNIPDFRLLVFRDDRLEWTCKVVVGDLENNTVIFNDELEYIVFSPYWVLPPSIVRKETLPALQRDPAYLRKHQMEVVNSHGNPVSVSASEWKAMKPGSFSYSIRQKPGKNNSLGWVKFLFPNEHHIYLHDTPSRSLFGETNRAFSHGCIRVAEPLKLARFLLRNDPGWPDEKIRKTMYGGKETWVELRTKVPVFITYFTAFVDLQGRLQFRNDVYQHDVRLEQMMFRD